MILARSFLLIAALQFTLFEGQGAKAMSLFSADAVSLKWEWPADRTPDGKILVKVRDVKKEGGGVFGIKKSPSLAESLPDPMQLSGEIIDGRSDWNGRALMFVLPAVELPQVSAGDHVGIAFIDDAGVCIAKAPADAGAEALRDWLASWTCGP
jgi:hypothetical protein